MVTDLPGVLHQRELGEAPGADAGQMVHPELRPDQPAVTGLTDGVRSPKA